MEFGQKNHDLGHLFAMNHMAFMGVSFIGLAARLSLQFWRPLSLLFRAGLAFRLSQAMASTARQAWHVAALVMAKAMSSGSSCPPRQGDGVSVTSTTETEKNGRQQVLFTGNPLGYSLATIYPFSGEIRLLMRRHQSLYSLTEPIAFSAPGLASPHSL